MAIPILDAPHALDFFLELQHAVQESFSCGRTAWHVDIHLETSKLWLAFFFRRYSKKSDSRGAIG